MPIHDVGYRGWHGKKTSPLTRWKIITYTGIRLALRSRWVARILFSGVVTSHVLGGRFFLHRKFAQ